MTGVKLSKDFGFLLIPSLVSVCYLCLKQIRKERPYNPHSTTDLEHFTNLDEYRNKDWIWNVGKRLFIRAEASHLYYKGGNTNDNREVLFCLDHDVKFAEINSKLESELKRKLISTITANQVFSYENRRTGLTKSPNFRLDMQGMVNLNKEPYHNLQIQLNNPTPTFPYTTCALVLIPKNADRFLSDRVVRRAFTDSYNKQAKITLEIRNQIQRKKTRKAKPNARPEAKQETSSFNLNSGQAQNRKQV